jgi:hypothetical protein
MLDIGRNWNTLLYTSIQSIPNMSDMSDEYAGHGKTGPFLASRNCVHILATCIIMLKHERMALDEWHDN